MMADLLCVSDSVAAVYNIINKVTPKVTVKRKVLAPEEKCGNVRKKPMNEKRPVSCPFCEKKFSLTANLKKHVVNIHKVVHVDIQSDEGSIRCGFDPSCGAAFDRSIFYRKHLQEIHELKLGKTVLFFDKTEDFETWRQTEQTRSGLKFIRRYKFTPSQKSLNVKKVTFVCSCPAQTKQEDEVCGTKRSRKLDSCCPARIDAVYRENNVIVSYFSTHLGHSHNTPEDYIAKVISHSLQQRKSDAYESAQQKAEFMCMELLKKLKAGQYTVEYMVNIALKLKTILNPSPAHFQKSLPSKTDTTATSCNSQNDSATNENEEHILGLREATIEDVALMSGMGNCEGSEEINGSSDTNACEKVPCEDSSNNVASFSGNVKEFSVHSVPSDCPFEKKVRKHGFLHSLETITPVISEEILKDDIVFPDPPSKETKTLHDDLWNKYKNSLKTSRSDHSYTGS